MADNLRTTQEMNRLLRSRTQELREHTRELSRQMSIQSEALRVMKSGTGPIDDDAISRINEMTDALMGASAQADEMGSTQEKAAKKSIKSSALIKGGILGIAAGFGIALGAGIKLYTSLLNRATQVYDEMLVITRAVEEVRKGFGELASGPGAAVRDMFSDVAKRGGELGVGIGKLYGFGFPATARAMQELNQIAAGMGATFYAQIDSLRDSGAELLLYSKGLGLAGEDLKKLSMTAIGSGSNVVDVLADISKEAVGLAKSFGMSGKAVGRDTARMASDVRNFQGVSVKALSAIAVRTRSLGLEMDTLTGVLQKFEDFEGAADSVSKLSQAFGIHLDTVRMMRETDPTKQIDSLRKSLFSAGKSAETMTRQELKLLASQTGMTAEQARLAFSLRNRGKSMSQIQKEQKKQKSDTEKQVEAMQSLADSIERAVVSLSEMNLAGKGFFGAFKQGMTDGLFRFGKFQNVAGATGKVMKELHGAGMEFADYIIDTFPGVQSMFEGFVTFLESGNLVNFFKVSSIWIKSFFESLSGGDKTPEQIKASLKETILGIKDTFIVMFFGEEGLKEGGEGAKKFAGAILKTIGAALSLAWDEIKPHLAELGKNMLKGIKDWVVKNPGKAVLAGTAILAVIFGPGAVIAGVATVGGFLIKVFAKAAPTIGRVMGIMFKGLGKFFKGAGKLAPKIFKAFGRFMKVGVKFLPKITSVLGKVLLPLNLLISGIVGVVKGFKKFKETGSVIEGLLAGIGAAINTFFLGIPKLIGKVFTKIFPNMSEKVAEWWTEFKTALSDAFAKLKSFVLGNKALGSIGDIILGPFRFVADAIGSIFKKIKGAGGDVGGAAAKGAEAKEGIGAGLTKIAGKIVGAAKKIKGALTKASSFVGDKVIGPAIDSIKGFFSKVGEALNPKKLTKMITTVVDFGKSLAGTGVEAFQSVVSSFSEIGRLMSQSTVPTTEMLIKSITDMSVNIKRIESSLGTLGTIDLRSKLTEMAAATLMGAEDSLTIDTDRLQLNINLDVSMDAREVARAVVETGLVPTTGRR